ncbi:O-antigen ligase family protein [Rhodococcus zopfii]|uniref:O-antigen ligase family protein n=1 Tax=Rhodococcus zopfii TaxID=43772 RepID=UPI001F114E95|nr:O-antigen ligase family protein [Rhodococcus zopfii]
MIAVVFFALAVLGFLVVLRIRRHRSINPGAIVILGYFLLRLMTYGVGLLHSGDAVVEANRTRALISVVASVGVVLYILARVETPRQRTIVLGCLATGLALACTIGVLDSFGAITVESIYPLPGLVLNTEDEYLARVERMGAERVAGTSEHAIEFSVLAAVTVPLTLHFARYAGKRWTRLLAAIGCLTALLAIPAAISRTGVIALVTALLIYMFASTLRRIGLAIAVGTLAIFCYSVALPTTTRALWETITGSEEDESVLGRTGDYAAVSRTFHEHPVFGLGLGGSPPSTYRYLDNEWLQALVQGGLVGVAAMTAVTVGAVFGFAAALRRATTTRERDQAYAMGAMIVGILSSSATFDLLGYQQVTLVLFVVFGVLWSAFSVAIPDTPGSPPSVDIDAGRHPRHRRPDDVR